MPYASRKGVCAVDGCASQAVKREWCYAHYERWHRHGDPLAGGTSPGEPERFYQQVVMSYDGDVCLQWPFGRHSKGYGQWHENGVTKLVHIRLCTELHGPPPTPEHQVAHSCGKGHLGCVTKRHLRWATPVENQADRLLHGTDQRGERHHLSRLTEADVRYIRSQAGRVNQASLAAQFGISFQHVSDIQRFKKWAWLDAPEVAA